MRNPWLARRGRAPATLVGDQLGRRQQRWPSYRRMGPVPARHGAPLVKGTLEDGARRRGIVSFVRAHGGQRLFCAFKHDQLWPIPSLLPAGHWAEDKGAPFTAIEDDTGAAVMLRP